jgi:hypothetical protein
MLNRIHKMCINNCINTAVKSCTEKQALSASRNHCHQITNDWQEAHVSHLICFIQNCNFNIAQVASAAIN